MWLWNIGVLIAVGLGTWWLTGFDKTAGGESKRGHYLTRALRCLAVTFLVAVFLWFIRGGGGLGGVPLLLIIPVSIALVLRSSLAEVASQWFLRVMDPNLHDDRELDSKRDARYLDTIAHLIKNGRKDDAIRLCQELKQNGELDPATLEMTLEFLGVKQESNKIQNPATQAGQLRSQNRFEEAERLLRSALIKTPSDAESAMMLMRIYVQDFKQPELARAVLRNLEKQARVAPEYLELARSSIDEWSRNKPVSPEPKPAAKPKSLEELLADKSYGSAIELLEQQIKAQPQDLSLGLKLAEVHAVCCHNFPRAEKIIRQLELAHRFPAEQIDAANARLKEWREASLRGK